MEKREKKIVLFASGNGTNAENIIRYFQHHPVIHVLEVITNNPQAGVIDRAKKYQVPLRVIHRSDFSEPDILLKHLLQLKTDLIVLAGFLWMIPPAFIRQFPKKIINLHPALLPAYGGKGMYGMHVHEAVLAAGEKKSGITIHYVNEKYDAGQIIFQTTTDVLPHDTPELLAQKIHQLEYRYFPQIIERLLAK